MDRIIEENNWATKYREFRYPCRFRLTRNVISDLLKKRHYLGKEGDTRVRDLLVRAEERLGVP
jgi:hypothetical protein